MEIIETNNPSVVKNNTIQITCDADKKYTALIINYPLFKYLEAKDNSKENLIKEAINIYKQMGTFNLKIK